MTKKAAKAAPVLAVRTRRNDGPSFAAKDFDIRSTNDSLVQMSSAQGSMHSLPQMQMYCFGQYENGPLGYTPCSPLQPILHFTGSGEMLKEELPVEDLSTEYIDEEFATWAISNNSNHAFPHSAPIAFPTTYGNDVSWTGFGNYFPQASIFPQQDHAIPPTNPGYVVQTSLTAHPNYTLYSGNVQLYSSPSTRTASSGRRLLPRKSAPPDAYSEAAGADDQPNGQRKKRALSPMAREEARRVRLVGACARCHAMKEKCDLKRPCGKCSGKAKRILDFYCMSELPETRYGHLFTDDMYGHLDLKDGKFFDPDKMPQATQEPKQEPFILRLHQYFDDPELKIPVYIFKPKCPSDTKKSVFPINPTNDGHEVHRQEIESPPLVPALSNSTLIPYINEFRTWVRRWLECAEYHDDLRWHETMFREEHGKPWPRAVLAEVCQFHHKVILGRCPALKNALQATVLTYMLGHSFYVPHEDIEQVLQKRGLITDYDGTFRFVSPLHVDRFIKALLFQFFKAIARAAFKYYQTLCSPNKFSRLARDRILATTIVLLIVAGSQQSKAVEKAAAKAKRGQEMNRDTVYAYIQEVEQYINDLLIKIWEYKFQDCSKWEQEVPQERVRAHAARSFDLLGRFEASYNDHGNDFPFSTFSY